MAIITSVVRHFSNNFSNNYLTEEEETSIISMWPALHTRLVSHKAISPNDVFSNLLASRPDDVKDCLISLDLMLTSTPSTAKCGRGFSAMNHLKCNLQTILGQNTLSDFDANALLRLCNKMYFLLVFEVISCACFPLTPAAPFIVSSMLLLVSF